MTNENEINQRLEYFLNREGKSCGCYVGEVSKCELEEMVTKTKQNLLEKIEHTNTLIQYCKKNKIMKDISILAGKLDTKEAERLKELGDLNYAAYASLYQHYKGASGDAKEYFSKSSMYISLSELAGELEKEINKKIEEANEK